MSAPVLSRGHSAFDPSKPLIAFSTGCLALGLGAATVAGHALLIAAAIIIAVWVALAVSVPSPIPTTLLVTAVLLAPDTITLGSFRNFPITPRVLALTGLLGAVTLAVARGKLAPRFPVGLAWSFLVGAAVLGGLAASRPLSLFPFFLLLLAPFFVGATLGQDAASRTAVVNGLVAGTLILSAVGLIEFLINHDFLVGALATSQLTRVGHIRANAGWSYPVTFGAFVCLSAFFVIERLGRKSSKGLFLGLLLMGSAAFATQSRAAIGGLIVGTLVFAASRRALRGAWAVIIACAVATASLSVLPIHEVQAFRNFITSSSTTGTVANANVAYRGDVYSASVAAVREHPLFGYGYGATQSIARNQLSAFFGNDTDVASLPLSFLVELGVAGFVGFYALVTAVSIGAWRRRTSGLNAPALAGILGSGVAFVTIVGPSVVAILLLVLGVFSRATNDEVATDLSGSVGVAAPQTTVALPL